MSASDWARATARLPIRRHSLDLRWLVFAGLLLCGTATAADQSVADKALRSFPKNSWFDADSGTYIPPQVEPAEDEPLRRTGQVSPAKTKQRKANDWWSWIPSLPNLSWLQPWIRVLVFGLLAIVLAVVVALLTHLALRNYMPQRFGRKRPTAAIAIDPTRISDLPFEVATADAHPLAQAEHYLQAGDYDRAIAFLYGYLLLALDQARWIHLQKGKTNRMYLRELQARPELCQIVQPAMFAFEDSYFGKHALSRQTFISVWNRMDEFHQIMRASQVTGPAGSSSVNRILASCCLVVLLSGCSEWLPEMVPFGSVTSPDINRSRNGLGLHREMWEASGARCLTPQKLSPKLDDVDVVVLVGQSFDPPGQSARRWLEHWLSEKSGRSVVYFGRDFNADIFYRRLTLPQLSPEAQRRGAELLAQREAAELNQRVRELEHSAYCNWFYLETGQPRDEYDRFSGQWQAENPEISALSGSWPVRTTLRPPDDPGLPRQLPLWIDHAAVDEPSSQNPPPTEAQPHADTLSEWQPREIDSLEQWETARAEALQSEVLLSGDDGRPLIFRLTSERFYGSQILILTNGAPLLNGSLVLPVHQRIGELLLDACLPAERVALLAFGEQGLAIGSTAEQDNRAAGLEMLTVWPLSGITMPAALLGIIVCAWLLPILGRPQPLAPRSVSDFGLHIDAIGRMLYEARDARHARTAIANYFTKVRGESPPDWLASIDDQD